jgi:hypothetical protein
MKLTVTITFETLHLDRMSVLDELSSMFDNFHIHIPELVYLVELPN